MGIHADAVHPRICRLILTHPEKLPVLKHEIRHTFTELSAGFLLDKETKLQYRSPMPATPCTSTMPRAPLNEVVFPNNIATPKVAGLTTFPGFSRGAFLKKPRPATEGFRFPAFVRFANVICM